VTDSVWLDLTHQSLAEAIHTQADADSTERIVVDTSEDSLDQSVREWLASPEADGIRGLQADLPLELWNEFPAEIAARVVDPGAAGAVSFPASQLTGLIENANTDSVWRQVIQAADAGTTIEAMNVTRPAVERPGLAPDPPGRDRRWLIEAINDLQCPIRRPNQDQQVAWTAIQAGLLQLHDALDASHSHSQSIEGEGTHGTGDYWHGIMHRREPDFGNAAYWFRRVGHHPVFDELAEFAGTVIKDHPHGQLVKSVRPSGHWSSIAMIDLCNQAVSRGDRPLSEVLAELQWGEMLLLLRYSWQEFQSA